MRRRWVFRISRLIGRLAGLAAVGFFAWLCWRWASPHLWLQILLLIWTVTFIPIGWVSGSMIAQHFQARLFPRRRGERH
jgi:hypothetical protein